MKKGDKLFIRIDYRNEDKKFEPNDFEKHIEYLEGVALERCFLGGGFEKEKGGMIIFKAKDIKEARKIVDNDPIIRKKLYNYKIYEWNLKIVSKHFE